MKRALKKQVKAVLDVAPNEDAQKQMNNENKGANRKARTQAAMIGLALSMGASSLLVTRQSDQAQAAEPVGSQNTASNIAALPDTEANFAPTQKLESQAVSNASAPKRPATTIIIEGAAVSQVPGLGATWQAAANTTPVQVPTPVAYSGVVPNANFQQSQVNYPVSANVPVTSTVEVVGPEKSISTTTASKPVNAQLKAQQQFALNRLKEKSNRLKESLAEWRSEENNGVSSDVAATIEPTASQSSLVSKLKQSRITSSSTLQVPTPIVPTAVVTPATSVHEVKPGDTLAVIAAKYGTSVSELVKANNLGNPDRLQVNQALKVPGVAAVANQQVALNQSNSPILATVPVAAPVTPTVATVPTPVAASVAENSQVNNIEQGAETTVAASEENGTVEASQGMGGDSPIPTAFVEMQKPANRGNLIARAKDDKASQNLLDEIERLREKYRAQQSRGASSGNNVVVPTTVPAVPQVNQANQIINRPAPVAVPMPNRAGLPVPAPMLPTVGGNMAYPAPAPLPRANQAGIPINVPTVPRANNRPFQIPFPRANQAGIPINVPTANEPVNPQWNRFNNNDTRNARNAAPIPGQDANQSLGGMRGTQVSPQLPNSLAAVDRYLPQAIDENTPGAPGGTNSAGMIWPSKGTLTSGYGWRWGRMHRGIDIAAPTGTPIYAVADGVVERAGWNNGGYGQLVEVRHADGTMTRYAHNSRILVQTGQQVRQGQNISLMGSTGFSTGPHLHFEIHAAGKGAVNPIAFLPQNRM